MAVASEARRARLRVRELAPDAGRTLVLAWRRRASVEAALRSVAAEIRSALGAAPPAGARRR
jgi:hypothetical protein